MTAQELIDRLEAEDPEAEVRIEVNDVALIPEVLHGKHGGKGWVLLYPDRWANDNANSS